MLKNNKEHGTDKNTSMSGHRALQGLHFIRQSGQQESDKAQVKYHPLHKAFPDNSIAYILLSMSSLKNEECGRAKLTRKSKNKHRKGRCGTAALLSAVAAIIDAVS